MFRRVKEVYENMDTVVSRIWTCTPWNAGRYEVSKPLRYERVYWDFVELPSQILENWCYEKACLDIFAKHHETGELIPADLVDRIKRSSTYHEAYATVRQLSFGLLDMSWHSLSLDEANAITDVGAFEEKAFAVTELFPKVEGTNMSVQFSHIFAGGYAAGYYSYKWAEVLDADAFSVFKKNGVFDSEKFRYLF